MEIDESKLRTLSMKAWSWVDKISDEIENESTIVCRHCSEHRLRHGIAESPLLEEQKQRLIAIKDSLKDVDNMLVVLQRMQSHQRQQCQEAFIKLEKSRKHLIENIKHFQEQGGKLNVIEELNACFRNENTEKQVHELKVDDDNSRVFTNCVRGFFNPLNWHGTAKTAITLALISVSVTSTYNFRQSRQENRCASSTGSVIARNFDFLAIDSDSPMDVSYGRG
ncbi:hypothetical protein DCAR_0518419 [Daucus carota subsp. sativus]|nr:PREDICTED: uncharacterized protein LOC108222082 isoform X1 [Daucus carota subsp. sativus]XP_017251461.1 PREDICTED: uncharacterized protein LOC108222082 isoform X1 [Daucus carota subsp. sativus]WOG99071.1 hypothetical protein DCAR_0518419 [Daucus carota subsp. sativus]